MMADTGTGPEHEGPRTAMTCGTIKDLCQHPSTGWPNSHGLEKEDRKQVLRQVPLYVLGSCSLVRLFPVAWTDDVETAVALCASTGSFLKLVSKDGKVCGPLNRILPRRFRKISRSYQGPGLLQPGFQLLEGSPTVTTDITLTGSKACNTTIVVTGH